jgi:hypothetical protein
MIGPLSSSRTSEIGLCRIATPRSRKSSSTVKEQHNNKNEQKQAQSAARIVTPIRAVRPCGQSSENCQQQDDWQNQEHMFAPSGSPGPLIRRLDSPPRNLMSRTNPDAVMRWLPRFDAAISLPS